MKDPILEHEDYKKELTSDFNEAKFQIYRLHILWLNCNNVSQAGKLIEWKWKLDTIWRELSPDAKEKDKYREEKDKYFTQIQKLNNNISEAKNDAAIYNALQEKEIFLRNLQEGVGKGSKKRTMDEEDFDE